MSAKRIDPARVAPTTVAKLIPKLGRTSVGALAVLTLILVFQNLGKAAQDQLPPDALPFSLSYTITGDFAVASMDLLPQPDNQDGDPGYQTGTIHVGWKESKFRRASDSEWTVFGSGYEKVQAFRSQIDNFVRSIRGHESPLISLADALASVEVIEAAYADLRRSHWVHVGVSDTVRVAATLVESVEASV